MKKYLALATAMLLTLGTAVAGTLIYGNGSEQSQRRHAIDTHENKVATSEGWEASPEMIAMWKATAASVEYVAPKVPI
ncbi:MAG TPA: hypothetical protein VF161_11570 [Steroidobacteraceae bacterium]